MGKPLKLFLSMLLQMPWNWIRSINFISPSVKAVLSHFSRSTDVLNDQINSGLFHKIILEDRVLLPFTHSGNTKSRATQYFDVELLLQSRWLCADRVFGA